MISNMTEQMPSFLQNAIDILEEKNVIEKAWWEENTFVKCNVYVTEYELNILYGKQSRHTIFIFLDNKPTEIKRSINESLKSARLNDPLLAMIMNVLLIATKQRISLEHKVIKDFM